MVLRSWRLFATRISAIVGALAGGWVLYRFPPTRFTFYPHCVFHDLTGLDCPGCGTTRALHALLRGDIAGAFRFNPILFVMAAVAVCAVPSLVRGESPRFLKRPWFGWTCVVVISAYWIVRNTAIWPW